MGWSAQFLDMFQFGMIQLEIWMYFWVSIYSEIHSDLMMTVINMFLTDQY